MKKAIYLILTLLLVLSCRVDGNVEDLSTAVESDTRAQAPWILCPNRSCSNHNMGLYQTYTYEQVKDEVHVNGKCVDCNRDYYHKKDYTIRTTKHQCVMSGGCGYTTYTKDKINIVCKVDPNEGKFIRSYGVPVCDNHYCDRYRKTMLQKMETAPSFIIKGGTWAKCSQYCPFEEHKMDGNKYHSIVRMRKNIQYYKCTGKVHTTLGGSIYSYPCTKKNYSYDTHHVVCYRE